jgi:hypothetical protein
MGKGKWERVSGKVHEEKVAGKGTSKGDWVIGNFVDSKLRALLRKSS